MGAFAVRVLFLWLFKLWVMIQLNLFDKEGEKEKESDKMWLPPHMRTKGGGNIAAFLKQQYNSGYTGATKNPIPKPIRNDTNSI